MFPAEALPAAALKAWRAVLPRNALLFPVGGIRPDNMAPYWAAGADGFGTGSNLYAPGATADRGRGRRGGVRRRRSARCPRALTKWLRNCRRSGLESAATR